MTFLAARFRTQHVTGPGLDSPHAVVNLLCAVQSQDYPNAKWSLGQRVTGATDAIIEDAFNRGDVLRTHVLRPTWHFVLPADIRWLLALTAPHVHRLNAYQYKSLELDPKTLARTAKLLERSLRDANHLTRPQLARVLAENKIPAESLRLAYIVMHAELEALVCSGPMRGKQHTYALLDERVPPAPTRTRDDALAELAYRFYHGHAPSTLKHFVWWSGLTVADARRGTEAARSRLTSDTLHGTEWFGLGQHAPAKEKLTAHLIPEYDESLTGSKDFGDIDLPGAKAKWTDPFLRPVVVGGRRAGTWKRTVGKREVVLELNLFATLSAAQQRAVDTMIEGYSRYLGLPVRRD